MTSQLRILLVEDNELFRIHLRHALRDRGVDLREAADLATGLLALETEEYDCAVVDLQLPDGDGRVLLGVEPQFPVVFLTATSEETAVIQTIRAGAEDYLIKTAIQHDLGRELLLAVRKAIERYDRRRQLERSQQELSETLELVTWKHAQLERQVEEHEALFNLAPVGYLTLDRAGRVLETNDAGCHITGYGRSLLIGMPLVTCLSRESIAPFLKHLWLVFAGEECESLEVEARQRDRALRRIELSFLMVSDSTVRVGLVDLTRQMRMREALAATRGAARGLSDETSEAVIELSADGVVIGGNSAVVKLFGVSDLRRSRLDRVLTGFLLREGRYECIGRRDDGSLFQAEATITCLNTSQDARWMVIVHDVSQDWRVVGHLLDVAEAERRRLGQELHDNLGQRLAATSFVAGSLHRRLKDGNPDIAALARRLVELSQQSIVEARSLAQGLYPPELETHGLLSALRRLGQDLEQIFGIRCRMELEDCGFAPGQPSLHVYRIVQEALNNAVRHGKASHTRVRLVGSERKVLLCIEDDGQGLDKDAPETARLGLIGMRHHSQMLGGTLELIPNQPTGVVVRCLLPYP